MNKACENCKWYRFIDSAYGNCMRFPPNRYAIPKGLWGYKVENKYPRIIFDCQVCGEYKEK